MATEYEREYMTTFGLSRFSKRPLADGFRVSGYHRYLVSAPRYCSSTILLLQKGNRAISAYFLMTVFIFIVVCEAYHAPFKHLELSSLYFVRRGTSVLARHLVLFTFITIFE